MGSDCFMGMDFQFSKTEQFWGWMVVTVAQQCEGTQCRQTVPLKEVRGRHFGVHVITISQHGIHLVTGWALKV